jgi:hypothetical protein
MLRLRNHLCELKLRQLELRSIFGVHKKNLSRIYLPINAHGEKHDETEGKTGRIGIG